MEDEQALKCMISEIKRLMGSNVLFECTHLWHGLVRHISKYTGVLEKY